MVLKKFVFLGGQLKLLGVQSSSELSGINNSLSEWVMILEELTDSDSVSLYVLHDFSHESH